MLLGNPWMGNSMGMNPWMGGGSDPYSMAQMMNQFMGQGSGFSNVGYQAPQYGTNQPGSHVPTWQQPGQSPVYNIPVPDGQPQFNPNPNSSPYQQFQDLKDFATRNGSRDGTPIADWTNIYQDMSSAQYAGQLAGKQAGVVGQAIEQAPAGEKALLKTTEENLAAVFQKAINEGKPLSQNQRDLMTSTAIDNLFQEGKVGAGVGNANRQYLELNRFQSQTEANLYLKWNQPLPADLSREAVEKSPYNAANRQ